MVAVAVLELHPLAEVTVRVMVTVVLLLLME